MAEKKTFNSFSQVVKTVEEVKKKQTEIPTRKRKGLGLGDLVNQSVPIRHEDWLRIKMYAASKGMTQRELFIKGISKIFEEDGLPPIGGN